MQELTQKQQAVFDCIKQLMKMNGHAPTRIEIADYMGFSSPNASQEHIKTLVHKGYLESHPKIARGLRLVNEK